MTQALLEQTRQLVRKLTVSEKKRLLDELRTSLGEETATAGTALPVIHLNVWPADLPLHRADLYDDRGR